MTDDLSKHLSVYHRFTPSAAKSMAFKVLCDNGYTAVPGQCRQTDSNDIPSLQSQPDAEETICLNDLPQHGVTSDANTNVS